MRTEKQQGRRTTIKDIAERAGVSKGAVSYALNGRPGVSEETRDRILAIADELGWYPNRAARALSASRADACGLILARPATTIALEPFFMEFIAGVEAELSPRAIGLTIQLVRTVEEEIAIYRRWFGEHRVDGVFVVDVTADDPRVEALHALGLPAVVIGGPLPGTRAPGRLARRGVRCRRGRSVPRRARPSQDRAGLGRRGVRPHRGAHEGVPRDGRARSGCEAEVVVTDYTPESGARATRRLLSSPEPPTAIIFDSDLLAVTGLGVAQQMGFDVPDDLSLIGWDDSLISRVVHPPLTAITRDIGDYGATAARHLLAVLDGAARQDVEVARGELTPRGSTAPPRSALQPTRPRGARARTHPAQGRRAHGAGIPRRRCMKSG